MNEDKEEALIGLCLWVGILFFMGIFIYEVCY